jgi:hypothetical protein
MRTRPVCFALLAALAARSADLPASWQAALSVPRADSLRGHVSFLASDLLEGRDTPSRGLDLAAEYIAAQFRRAGIDPAGDDGYFHTSQWIAAEPSLDGLKLSFTSGGRTIDVPAAAVSPLAPRALELEAAPVLPLEPGSLDTVQTFKGKIVLVRAPARGAAAFIARLSRLEPAALILLDTRRSGPAAGRRLYRRDQRPDTPVVSIRGAVAEKLAALDTPATVTARVPAWREQPVALRNVIGILRGSDPALADTYFVLTAHYDHLGNRGSGDDTIYNGANDDASGVAALIETASALATVLPRPKRSIVFLAVFGEERGLLGSREYARSPIFPLAKSIANLNLEQLGRTDSDDGPHENRVAMTGFGYSTLTPTLVAAGERLGISVSRHEKNSDAFFTQSDNAAFAEKGIPAHTLSTGYLFPDYHRPGDHWDKLDYPHMEKVARLVTLGALMVADAADPPRWDDADPRARRFRDARGR